MIRLLRGVDQRLPSNLGHLCLVLVAVAGCGDDAQPICEARTLRIDGVEVATSATRARELALDLNADKMADNAAGLAAATLKGQIAPAFDLTGAASARLADDVVWSVDVETCDDGTATLVEARMPLSTVWDPMGTFADPGFVAATRSAITLAREADGTWRGKLGMGFDVDQLTEAAIAPLAPYFDKHQLFLNYLDTTPKDGHITVDELREANIVKLLLAPDLGKHGTSFAIGFSARE